MEERLYCGICKQILEEPRLLSCLHSFCTQCLIAKKSFFSDYATNSRQDSIDDDGPLVPLLCDRRKSSFAFSAHDSDATTIPDEEAVPRIVCPSCQTETLLTNRGVTNLPVNFLLQNKILSLKNRPPNCETCSSTTQAYCRCMQCDIAMCALCTDSHTKFRDTALHDLVNITPAAAQNKPVCIHHLQEFGFFCLGCTELICSICCTTLHLGHKYEVAGRAAENYTAVLRQALDTAKPAYEEISKGAMKIKSLHSKIAIRCDRVDQEISKFFEAYKESLAAHQQSLLEELNNIRDKRLALLDDNYNGCKDKLRGSQIAIDYTEELLEESSSIELLSLAPALLGKLDLPPYAATDTSHITSKVSEFLQFLPEEKASTDGQFQLFGIISTQSLSPENCTLQTEGLFSCRQHKRATFTLTTRDCENELLTHGGEKIETELRYKDATQREIPVSIVDEGEGTYVLSFTPDIAGSLSWSISIRNISIQGSPFTVCVSSLRPHKGVYHCCAFCSSKGNKSVTCGCGSQMPGGYKGCGHGHEGHPGRRHWSCCGNVLHNSECGRPNSFYNF